MVCDTVCSEHLDGNVSVSGHAASQDKENISGGALLRGSESARAKELVAQAVAGPQIIGLPVDADFQLSLNQKQMVFQARPWRTVIGDARAWFEFALKGLGGQSLSGRGHRTPPEPDRWVCPDRLHAAADDRGEVILNHVHQPRHGQAIGRAELAQHARSWAYLCVLKPGEGGAAHIAASCKLVQRPTARSAQTLEALCNQPVNGGSIQVGVFHI
jgi:hypothetical protein